MHVSHSELNRLIKQALEGEGLAQGVYQTAATSIVWSETHGFNGLEIFEASLAEPNLFNVETSLDYISEDATTLMTVMNVSSSAAFWGRAAADLCVAKAMRQGYFELTIDGGRDHALMLNRLSRAADKNLYASLMWRDGEYLVYASAQPGRCCIDYKVLTEFEHVDKAQAKLVMSNVELEPTIGATRSHYPPSDAKAHYLASVDNGIEISSSLWNTLNKLASNVLVESTEQSRSGAGA